MAHASQRNYHVGSSQPELLLLRTVYRMLQDQSTSINGVPTFTENPRSSLQSALPLYDALVTMTTITGRDRGIPQTIPLGHSLRDALVSTPSAVSPFNSLALHMPPAAASLRTLL